MGSCSQNGMQVHNSLFGLHPIIESWPLALHCVKTKYPRQDHLNLDKGGIAQPVLLNTT